METVHAKVEVMFWQTWSSFVAELARIFVLLSNFYPIPHMNTKSLHRTDLPILFWFVHYQQLFLSQGPQEEAADSPWR